MQQDPVVCPRGWGPRADFLGSLWWLSPLVCLPPRCGCLCSHSRDALGAVDGHVTQPCHAGPDRQWP